MKLRQTLGLFTMAGLLGVASAAAQDQSKPPASDNTKMNQRDRSGSEPTADQAKNNMTDRDLMQKIRKSVMDDQSLSTYAHNVKIIAQNGKVTLEGPVRSTDEKQNVEQKATEVAGAGNVADEMTIRPERNKSK